MSQLVLSLFPGIGLLDMAFEEAGFCVVRGPDLLWGGDIHKFHAPAGKFDGIIGGPPCQAFSQFRHIVIAQGHTLADNLIPEYERVVGEARPRWFIMENVPDAPVPIVDGYQVRNEICCDTWVGGETSRKRRFSFGTWCGSRLGIETLALHRPDPEPAILATGGNRKRPVAIGGSGGGSGKPKRQVLMNSGRMVSGSYLAHAIKMQGLPAGFMDDAPFTTAGKIKVVGNGVPLPMGRAVAKAVLRALESACSGPPVPVVTGKSLEAAE
jgi:DNA (cytosine-5)-methyltransferase 1